MVHACILPGCSIYPQPLPYQDEMYDKFLYHHTPSIVSMGGGQSALGLFPSAVQSWFLFCARVPTDTVSVYIDPSRQVIYTSLFPSTA